MPASLQGRIALVTGASRGIGRAVAIELARAGAHIIALARTQGGLEDLDDSIRADGGEATLMPCDIKDFDALDRLAAVILTRWGKLDILIGNAGALGPMTPLGDVEQRQWDEIFAVNVTANWRLIRALDPLLRASDAGRAVFMTAGLAHAAALRPYRGPYAASKAALDALVRTYAAETKNITSIKVMAVDPGALRTSMRALDVPGEDPSTLRRPEDLAPKIVAICAPEWKETGKLYNFSQDRVLSFSAPD